MSYDLYVKLGKKYKKLSAVVTGPNLKPVIEVLICDAFDKYIKNCTSKKCPKNKKNEVAYFKKFTEFLERHNVRYVHEIKKEHLDTLETEYLKIMKPSSLNRRFSVYKHFFKMCKDWEMIAQNPMEKIKPKKIEENHFKPWSDDDFRNFIKRCDGVYKVYFLFLRLTGCRPVEAQRLLWTDINYDQKYIGFRSFKNKNVSRTFPLTSEIDKVLHIVRKIGLNVFIQDDGKLINSDRAYQYAKHRLKADGLKHLCPYGLRHAFATKLNENDINAFNIRDLLGHRDIKTTLRYIHKNDRKIGEKIKKIKFY